MISEIINRFRQIRNQTLELVAPLETEDFVVQPIVDVSPPKWHLAHTTWFFEVFILQKYVIGYKLFDENYLLLFNSYYVSAGDRWSRADRGSLTRPTVDNVLKYRVYVEAALIQFLEEHDISDEMQHILEVGLNHEQQHQELLLYDIKYILGHNPLFPRYSKGVKANAKEILDYEWLTVLKGNYHIGKTDQEFSYDNEEGKHEIHLEEFEIANRLVSNEEYLKFIESGGYQDHRYWLSDGWDWLNANSVKAPMYWLFEDERWFSYSLNGLAELSPEEPVSHISYYEADAFAKWRGCRLPTESEWEVAALQYGNSKLRGNFVEDKEYSTRQTGENDFLGNLWEWTASAYLPYPYYKVPDGALGEYNGKFMIGQHVLRGGSYATPRSHIRITYRNFFQPQMRWLFNGIRLARHTS